MVRLYTLFVHLSKDELNITVRHQEKHSAIGQKGQAGPQLTFSYNHFRQRGGK